jgi:hypothetical protein
MRKALFYLYSSFPSPSLDFCVVNWKRKNYGNKEFRRALSIRLVRQLPIEPSDIAWTLEALLFGSAQVLFTLLVVLMYEESSDRVFRG